MYNDKKILIGLSGGINSMAVLCWLVEQNFMPKELHLFYAHFFEHSPDTFQFVADGIRYAKKHFDIVKVKITKNSVLEYFEKVKMIPHPALSPCSYYLKIEPMEKYCFDNSIQVDMIGYIRTEAKRIRRMRNSGANTLFLSKEFPIELFNEDWCFEIVDKCIGWHPAIYDIRDEKGKRKFTHNNCLPCKNMHVKDMVNVNNHFPNYMDAANELSKRLKAYWGRNAVDYYTEFGKEDYEPGQCETCAFD